MLNEELSFLLQVPVNKSDSKKDKLLKVKNKLAR
jgi:hypothetical protein